MPPPARRYAARRRGLLSEIPGVAEGVGDRVATVAAEIARADFHARRRLAALGFRHIEQLLDALDGRWVEALCAHRLECHLVLDETFEDPVEHVVRWQRILVLLVRAKLGARGLLDDPLWHYAPLGPACILGH